MHPDPAPYDAVLLVSFGGPEKPEDVIPFLANVTRGRGIPEERLAEVGQHYTLFGGRSPINDQNRALLDALATDFAGVGLDLPIYWGNRNWDPMLRDTVARMAGDGIRRAACFVTSAYSSYSGCRQYREDLAGAVDGIEGAPVLDRLRAYFNHPGFVEPFVDATLSALAQVNPARRDRARLVFVTHSIPTAMNEGSGEGGGAYVRQHQEVMRQVVERVRAETGHRHDHELVYCSRSGSPHVPWLEPDVNDHLEALVEAEPDAPPVVIVPIGFVSDHMEVIYDLDTEAMATAERLGVECVRASTPGVDPRFVAMVRDLVLERAAVERGEQVDRATVGDLPACWDRCLPDCCPNPRGLPLPTVGTRE